MNGINPFAVTAPERPTIAPGEQRLLLNNVSWDEYVAIGEALKDRPGLRMTYDHGSLEFMTHSIKHEWWKQWFMGMLLVLAREFKRGLHPGGNMTFQRKDLERGLEPDDCWWIANEPRMRLREVWDPSIDPPPDLVVEIEYSRSALNRMDIYAMLGIPEVWRFDGNVMTIHRLHADGHYEEVASSPTFPGIPASEFVAFARPHPERDLLAAMDAFCERVRQLRTEN